MHRMCSVAGCTSKKACLEQGLATLSSDTPHLVVNASIAISFCYPRIKINTSKTNHTAKEFGYIHGVSIMKLA